MKTNYYRKNGPSGKPKIFVLDTNVILHDHAAIRHFKDNDLVIPLAVIEELDKFKKGNDTLAYNARGFMREINKLTDRREFGPEGISLGEGLGTIRIVPNHPFPEALRDLFADDIPDHRILSTAMWIRDTSPERFTALVSMDINLRLKAKAAGMPAQDYLTDKVEENVIEDSQREVVTKDDVDYSVIQSLTYGQDNSVDWKEVTDREPRPNTLFRLRSGDETVGARYDAGRGVITLVRTREAYGIKPRNEEQKFAIDACLNRRIPLVSLTGGAGTGKTLIALAAALEQEKDFDQIILTRPTVVLGGQDIGFLPGDQKSKMSPYIQPLMDNLDVIRRCFRPGSKQAMKIDELIRSEKLLISPLAYIRGRSLGRVFMIVDEAQNLTPHEVKTIITRAGEGTKMVFTGDIFQIDQPYLDQWSNGLSHLGEKMSGQRLFQHVFLRKGERSELSDLAATLL
ncbi:MAG: PhoH family protein [Bacteroidales bacterium]|nr:PhoH family protein [Bacteroidales bacterium]